MTTDTQHDREPDRPPAGTPCCVCRAAGHWCQADQFTAGDSGNGICNDCADGKECEVRRLQRKKSEPFAEERLDAPAAPVRSIPVAEGKQVMGAGTLIGAGMRKHGPEPNTYKPEARKQAETMAIKR